MRSALSILVIDENKIRASIIEQGLRDAGHDHVILVHQMDGLVRHISNINPDVIVIDLENPNRDQLEHMFQVSRAVRRPVAMFVDKAESNSIEAAVDAGVSAYVVDGLKRERVKPILDMGMVFPVSTHNYELRYWLASGDIHPGFYSEADISGQIQADALLSVTPPPQMPATLEAGTIHGYCCSGLRYLGVLDLACAVSHRDFDDALNLAGNAQLTSLKNVNDGGGANPAFGMQNSFSSQDWIGRSALRPVSAMDELSKLAA